MKTRKTDLELLTKLLEYEDLSRGAREAFERWHGELSDGKFRMLTPKQRAWAEDELDKRQPQYRNDFSSGRVPIGKPVIVPDVLRPENLPKRPPPRKTG